MLHVFKIPAMKAIKIIECWDVDYGTAELVCKIMDDLELEGKMEPVG